MLKASHESEVLYCPLCDAQSNIFFKNKNQEFYRCPRCLGIFLNPRLHLNHLKEKAFYQTHNNDVTDKGYQKFVSPITNKIFKNFTKKSKGLDFGAGTGPVISKILTDKQFQIKLYDPFFHQEKNVLLEKYHYIACCEVIEHFHNPHKEFLLLKKLLKEKGILYCMTHIYNEKLNFKDWYYKNDPTHVFLYQNETFEWIKKEFNFSKLNIEKRLICLQN